MHRQHPITITTNDPFSVARARRRRHNRVAVVCLHPSVHPRRKSRPHRDSAVVASTQEKLRVVFAGRVVAARAARSDVCGGRASVAQGRDGRGLRTDGRG